MLIYLRQHLPCTHAPPSFHLLSSPRCAVLEKEAMLSQGLGASLLLPSAILSAASRGTCLRAPRPSAYSKPQSLSGQLGWQPCQPCQPCQPQATFLPMQPEVSAREGHTSLQASRAKYRSTKIRFPLREASPGQLKPTPPHWTQWGHRISLQGQVGREPAATKGTEVTRRNIILDSPAVPFLRHCQERPALRQLGEVGRSSQPAVGRRD